MQYIHYDALKRPVAIGDTVLTKGYGSSNMNQIAKVVKFTPKSVFIDITKTKWEQYLDAAGNHRWKQNLNGEVKRMKRDSSSFVVINEQLKHNYAAYPELYV